MWESKVVKVTAGWLNSQKCSTCQGLEGGDGVHGKPKPSQQFFSLVVSDLHKNLITFCTILSTLYKGRILNSFTTTATLNSTIQNENKMCHIRAVY